MVSAHFATLCRRRNKNFVFFFFFEDGLNWCRFFSLVANIQANSEPNHDTCAEEHCHNSPQ